MILFHRSLGVPYIAHTEFHCIVGKTEDNHLLPDTTLLFLLPLACAFVFAAIHVLHCHS